MEFTAPIVFDPIFMDRVWGGRRLEQLYGKRLPASRQIGESWELVDRTDAQSVVAEGPLAGTTLHELWSVHRAPIFGEGLPAAQRFPLLVKLLDCEERLSVQVHPPAAIAERFGGEPKTEMWFVMHADAGSEVFAGLKRGVTRERFEAALASGDAASLLHRVPTRPGDALLVPSGRIHAIGAGNVIFEVQQNSDTVYRVFDWNRAGLDGKPRTLHIRESLASIDFDDAEPQLIARQGERVASCEYFRVERWEIDGERSCGTESRFAVMAVLSGQIECGARRFGAGAVFLVPVSGGASLRGCGEVLRVSI